MAQTKEERAEKRRAYYHKNQEHARKMRLDWGRKNRQKLKASMLKFKYGISLEQYNLMKFAQGGVCAICNRKEWIKFAVGEGIRDLAVDHCHATGRIRGLLCSQCNRCIGMLRDDVVLVKNMAKYLTKRGTI